jgi:hypothetical protein
VTGQRKPDRHLRTARVLLILFCGALTTASCSFFNTTNNNTNNGNCNAAGGGNSAGCAGAPTASLPTGRAIPSHSASTSPPADPQSLTGEAKIVTVAPATGSCTGATLRVEVNVVDRISGSGQVWIFAAVRLSGGGTVYDAKTALTNKSGLQTVTVMSINLTRGTTRQLLVASANTAAEFKWLQENNENDGNSSWDANRRDLHGLTQISNAVQEITSC